MVEEADGPAMRNMKNMSKEERKGFSAFNILALLFGPFYYITKGMWRKAISLFLVCVVVVVILELLLEVAGFGSVGRAPGYGVAAVFAVRANIDYYKKTVLGENGWW